jgi:riboflavin kinase/FMN adenylyltransferase
MKTALTIGFFDGVHLGHQALLCKLREHSHTTILTFSNHPKELFDPPAPPLLIPLKEKLGLLKKYADDLIVVPFTWEFAQTTFEQLLSSFDLSHLLLGSGACFGKNKQGDEKAVKNYAKTKGFSVEYLPKTLYAGQVVSSSRIRHAMQCGDTALANKLLGKS